MVVVILPTTGQQIHLKVVHHALPVHDSIS
jgi:hypothetical protein